MTHTKKIIVLDVSTTEVLILEVEHNPADDLDVTVDNALTDIDRRLDDCSWMEIPMTFILDDVIHP